MPLGTARNKLVRMIMFQMLEKQGSNACFVCSKPMCVDTFSIEHKKPWLHIDTDLYWDLNNISFSHKSCNRPHRVTAKTYICIYGHPKKFNKRGKSSCPTCKKLYYAKYNDKINARKRELRELAKCAPQAP